MEVERKLAWIWKPASSNGFFSVRDKHNRVSRKMIKNKALEIFSSVTDSGDHNFDVYCYVDTAHKALRDKLFIWPSDILDLLDCSL